MNLEETTVEGQDKHHRVSFASISGKQVEAAFDGGLPVRVASSAQPGHESRQFPGTEHEGSGDLMPRVERYRHGTPCWVDLATTDLAGAKAFYAGLFGWEYVDEEMGEMDIGVYSMAMLDGSAAKINKGKRKSSVNPSRQVFSADRICR